MKYLRAQWLLIVACFFVSVLSHAFFIGQWFNGIYMIGPNDGLSQIVPFREMLYDHYADGNFFYSYEYGLGGGTFSQLAYYYATNLVFWVVCIVVFLLEALHLVSDPDVLFWAEVTLLVSVVRLSIVILLATSAFRYMRLPLIPSLTGAILYGASSMYFRHVTYWEFFSDSFLWLPMLVIGIEKVVRERKPGWLVTAVAISAFDNFYFAFIHCIFAFLYILLRWFIPLAEKEASRMDQLRLYIVSVMIGAGIGAFSFVPAIYGFFNNFRPSYEDEIPVFNYEYNILYDNYLLLFPSIFVLLFFVFRNYKLPVFRLFVILSVLIAIMHYMPVMWSVFNGFSAPQARFQYLASFAAGGAVAAGLSMWHFLKKREIFLSTFIALILYAFFYYRDPEYDFTDLSQSVTAIGMMVVFLVWLALAGRKETSSLWLICVTVIAANAGMLYEHQEENLYKSGNVEETTKAYILSDNYYATNQRMLIQSVLEQDNQPLARMEWKTDGRNNTPLIQGFTGTSVYSSVLNQNLLFFYYHDLEIDMKRESVSRYAGFGDRANLHSLFAGKYVMRKSGDETPIPYGFEKEKETAEYVIYKNSNSLPFVRTSSRVYKEDEVRKREILGREHAMLNGIVIASPEGKTNAPPEAVNLNDRVKIKEVKSEYKEGLLTVSGETGGVDLQIRNPHEEGDYYVSFYLNQAKGMTKGFPLHVNEFRTTRKPAGSIYRTKVNKLTIRVAAAETISIRVPQGHYQLENIEVFHENYQELEQAMDKKVNQAEVGINGNHISIEYENNHGDRYLTIPVPYEKGWQVHINGEKHRVEKANFAFLGTELEAGENSIEFVYYPPYFKLTLFISLFSFIVALCWLRWRRKKNRDVQTPG